MKKQVEDWILLADRDLQAAEILIKDPSPLTNIVAFLCQQSIEKYLKAFLIENDVPLIKTHDLVKLNKLIKNIEDLGFDKEKLILINEIYSESRYPSELGLTANGMPTNEQVETFIAYAKEVKIIIITELNKL